MQNSTFLYISSTLMQVSKLLNEQMNESNTYHKKIKEIIKDTPSQKDVAKRYIMNIKFTVINK